LTDHRYQLTTAVDRTSLAVVVHRSEDMVHFPLLQHYRRKQKNIQSVPSINPSVYSFRNYTHCMVLSTDLP